MKAGHVIDKNHELMRDSILGKKKQYIKYSNPLDPNYIVSTKSNRKMIIGSIEANKPKNLIKLIINKDSKRYIRVDDIEGAYPKEFKSIPEKHLPDIHPDF